MAYGGGVFRLSTTSDRLALARPGWNSRRTTGGGCRRKAGGAEDIPAAGSQFTSGGPGVLSWRADGAGGADGADDLAGAESRSGSSLRH